MFFKDFNLIGPPHGTGVDVIKVLKGTDKGVGQNRFTFYYSNVAI